MVDVLRVISVNTNILYYHLGWCAQNYFEKNISRASLHYYRSPHCGISVYAGLLIMVSGTAFDIFQRNIVTSYYRHTDDLVDLYVLYSYHQQNEEAVYCNVSNSITQRAQVT